MGYIEYWFKESPSDITGTMIENFIKRKIEENIYLDYKHIKKYENYNDLAKMISGFANSEGGLLLLGISEKTEGSGKNLKIFPEEITWGDSSLTKEKLEDNISTRIRPMLDYYIQPVRESNESSKVIFLIDVPKSKIKPHISNNIFYKRRNFKTEPMEYDEIKFMFSENYLQKENIINNIIMPLYGELYDYLNNHNYSTSWKSNLYVEINRKYRILLDVMQDDALVKDIDDLFQLIKRKENAFSQINNETRKIITNVIRNICKNKITKTVEFPDVHYWVTIKARLYTGYEEDTHPVFDIPLLYKYDIIEYWKSKHQDLEVMEVIYAAIYATIEFVFTKDEWDGIWEKCLIKSNSNMVFRTVWDNTDQIKKLGEKVKEKLKDLMI